MTSSFGFPLCAYNGSLVPRPSHRTQKRGSMWHTSGVILECDFTTVHVLTTLKNVIRLLEGIRV